MRDLILALTLDLGPWIIVFLLVVFSADARHKRQRRRAQFRRAALHQRRTRYERLYGSDAAHPW